jgi:hypothetical protein
MTELATTPPQTALAIPNIATGEVVSLQEASTDQIAEAVWAMREQETQFRNWKKLAGEELLRRMDANASWTMHEGQYDIKGDSPAPTREADVEPLMTELKQLVWDELVSADAIHKAVETVVTHKVKWGALDALRKLGGEVKERIDKHIREVDKVRRSPSVSLVRPEPPK